MRPLRSSTTNTVIFTLNFTEAFDHEEPPTYTWDFNEPFDHEEPPTYTWDFNEPFDA